MKLSESIRSNLEERNTKYREVEEIAESALKKIGLDGTRMVHQVANHGSQVFNMTYYAATELLQSNGENVGLNIVFGLEAASEKTTVTAFIQTHPALVSGISRLSILRTPRKQNDTASSQRSFRILVRKPLKSRPMPNRNRPSGPVPTSRRSSSLSSRPAT